MKRALLRNVKSVFLLFVPLLLLVLNVGTIDAQTLSTDGAVPTLNACGENGIFTVTIAKGATACKAGKLKLTFPSTGFEYVPGSAKIGLTVLEETDVTKNEATLTLPLIPAGSPTDFVTITYEAKATCEAIPLASAPDDKKPTVAYLLNGCNAAAQTGQSDIININFAVLNIVVTPNSSQGVIGSVITRVVKVTNRGNGSIGSFTIERTLGSSLTITSVTQPVGWAVDESDPNKYIYSGATLAPGGAVEFTETVEINACTQMQTNFAAYYGCTGKCTLSAANSSISAGISINQSIQPNLQLAVISNPVIICYNQEYEHVWTVKNNGTGYSSATKVFLSIDGVATNSGSYFNENSITVGGVQAAINPVDTQIIPASNVAFGTQGKIRQLSANIPDLAPGESKEIRFKQYYAAPVADCEQDLSAFSRAYTAYKFVYKHRDGCNIDGTNPEIQPNYSQTKIRTSYAFGGTNIGEVDIVTDYKADFLINNWTVELADITSGAYFDVILQLSAAIQTGFDMSQIKLFDPVAGKSLNPTVSNLGGGKYQLRINYGTADWPTGTQLNASGYHLQFPALMDCNTGSVASYTVTGQLNNGGSCMQIIQFACQTVKLNTHCGTDCATGGLDNGEAVLKRMTYGQVSKNPDDATPDLAAGAVDPENPPANFATRNFIGTDILKISQTGTVVRGSATPVLGWTEGIFSVGSPANLASKAVANSGTVLIIRGTDIYTAKGLPINTSIDDVFSIDLGIANLLLVSNTLPPGFTYKDDDVIVSSLEIQPMELFNAPTGIKLFPTTYQLRNAGANYSCHGDFSATGYYGPTWLQYMGGGGSQLTGCTPKANTTSVPSVIMLFRAVEYWRNTLFPNEFRQIATPKKATFSVPQGLTLVGLTVDLNNNSTTGSVRKVIPLSITDQSYTLDIEQVIKDLKGGGTAAYLDEGYEVRIYPSVVPTCKSTGTDVINVTGTMAGTFWNRGSDGVEHQYVNSPEVSIGTILTFTYQTDASLLTTTVTRPNVNATTNQAKWVVQVTNASTFRTFGNVWIGQTPANAGANIVSVQEVSDLNGTTPIGVASNASDGVFQLGNFGTFTAGNKYYLITAEYPGCDPGNIDLVYGSDCNAYPTSVASASCSTSLPVTLKYTPVLANLQTRIVNQNAGVARPKLCEQIPFEIEINNAGIGDASALVVSATLPSGSGLSFESGSLQLTAPFTANAGPYISVADVSVVVNRTAITFTIPAANVQTLKNGEKFRLKFSLAAQGCTFKSGQRITFAVAGKNACASDIANTSAASSNRVTIEGSPTNLPELSIPLSTVTVNTTNAGTDLKANYNFTLKNVGDGISNSPATPAYSFNIKLPDGWVFAGNPQDVVPAAQATYGYLNAEKGYVFNLAQDLNVGDEIKIINATLVYANTTTLACDVDFGTIYESAYTTFSPGSLCAGTTCQIDQLSVENQSTTFTVSKPEAPTGAAVQTFCAGNFPDLSSVVLADAGAVVWYNSTTNTAALDVKTPLVDGHVYYASNQLVAGSACESDRYAVTIKLDPMPVAVAGADQNVYAGGQFTMAANEPIAGTTGLWMEVLQAGEISQATIFNPSEYNSTVTVVPGKKATLRWTITSAYCTATDDVNLTYVLENDIAVFKTVDKAAVTAGQALVYTIFITNNGPGSLLAGNLITLIETLPAGLENISYLATGGVYNPSANTFKLDAALGTAQTVSLSINGTVAKDYKELSIVNKVSVMPPSGTTDADPTNNAAEVTTAVIRTADLSIVKLASSMAPIVGVEITFTLKARNDGPSDASRISISDLLPSGYQYVSSHTSVGAFEAVAGNWAIGNLNRGAEATLIVTAKTLATGNYANTATITGGEVDPDLTNNSSTVKPIPIASPPVAVDDVAATAANVSVQIPVLANDYPGLGNSPLVPVTVKLIASPANGTVRVNADGTFTYTPNRGFIGLDYFTYSVMDALGYSSNIARATVTITSNILKIPNVFTPNGDGNNDTFEIIGIEGYDSANLIIFNRWGNEVYKKNHYENNWNGNGLNEGTYYYIIRLKKNEKVDVYKGWVLLKH